jgi:Tfp pilus assembly protein PilF
MLLTNKVSNFVTQSIFLCFSYAAWFLLAEIYIQEKDWNTGLRYFRKLIDLHPQNEILLNSYGAHCFQAGKFLEAVEVFKR